MQSNLILVFVVQNLSSLSKFCMSIVSKRVHSSHIYSIYILSQSLKTFKCLQFFHNFI
jgi:hypothetical protein